MAEADALETFRPACWQAAFETVATALAEGAPVVLVLAPAGYGKTIFLRQLGMSLAAAGLPKEVVIVAPEATADGLAAPVRAALARSDAPLIAVDAAERLTDAALRDLLLLATAPDRAGRASLVLAGEPDLTKRIERLVPARQARSLPKATLPSWSQDDVLAYLRVRAAASGGQLLHVDATAVARLVEITRGRPLAICNIVGGVAAPGEVAGEVLPPWEARMADETAKRAVATSTTTRLRSVDHGGSDEAAPRDGVAVRGNVGTAPGLSDAMFPPLAAPPLTGTTVGVFGIGGGTRPRSTASRLARLAPMVLVALSIVAAGWALWSERLSTAGPANRASGSRMAAALSPKDPLQERAAPATPGAAEPAPAKAATTAVAEEPGNPAAAPSPPAEQRPAPAPAAPPPAEASRPAAAAPEPPAAAAPAPTAVTPAPEPAEAAATNADRAAPVTGATSGEIAELIARGDALLRLADLSAARQFYLLAARRGAAAGLTAAAGTYDPVFLRTIGVPGGAGDPRRAMELYRDAAKKGDTAAVARLRALIDAQREAGAIDAAEARRLSEP